MSDLTQPGQIIAGKYRVESILGQGGMGRVVSARHLGLGHQVAIKLLLREIREEDPSAEKRFEREARSAVKLQSQHVCRVLDAGMMDDGTPFLVMEHLDGVDVAQELTARGRLGVEEAARLVRQACEGISEAHDAGIVHRDLKPANLFLVHRPDGTQILKVLDFGVSKSLGPQSIEQLSLTKTSALVGSPVYMSPEQLRSSRDVDARTDVWSLGVILYEMVAGRTPFEGESMVQLATAIMSDEPPGLDELGVSAPDGFAEVVARALVKERDGRFGSAAELSQALSRYAPDPLVISSSMLSVPSVPQTASARGTGARPSAASPSDSSGEHSVPPVSSSTNGSVPKVRRRWMWWAAPLLLSLAAAGAFWLLARKPAGPSPANAQSAETSAPRHEAAEEAEPLPIKAAREVAEEPRADTVPPAALDAQAGRPLAAPLAAEPGKVPDEAPDEALRVPRETRREPSEAREERRARKRPRRRSRSSAAREVREPSAPAAKPEPEGISNDGLPDFGGRR